MRLRSFRPLAWLEGRPSRPLLVLFGLNVVDEFDRAAFGVLAPEIRRAFDLSNAAYGAIVGATIAIILALGLPVGLLADRVKRTRLVVAGALLWAGMGVVTGLAPSLLVLVLARVGAGGGKLVNDPVHSSLISDYYPASLYGRAFGFHRIANPVGNMLGPLMAGGLGALVGWRPTFVIVALPTVLLAMAAARLTEPLRGQSTSPELAAEAAKEGAIPFARARRQLFAIPSLKRIYTATFFFGAGVFALLPFVSLFLDDVYGVPPFGRGVIMTVGGAFTFVGTVLGGFLADRLRPRGPSVLARVTGTGVALYGLCLFLFSLSPVLALSVAFLWVANFFVGFYVAPNLAVQAVIIPPRIRGTGLAFVLIFIGFGTVVFSPLVGNIADADGIRAALVQFTPLIVIAGLVYLSAAKFVDRDAARAAASLAAEVELRRQRLEAGAQSLLLCRGVDVSYDQVQVLFGVDFELHQGDLVALLGTNGAGKSTLLKAISGLVTPASGAVFFEGRNITYHDGAETAALGIMQVPGGKGVFPSLTVAENLEVAKWLLYRDVERTAQALDEVLGYFPVLRERWNEKAGNLSGGEQQMLTLAQAFIARPKLLLIDELSLGLAPAVVESLLEVVRRIHAAGTTVVIVEQSVNVALTVAERAVFLEKGEVRFSGPTAELLHRPDVLRSVFLEGAASVMGADTGNGNGNGNGNGRAASRRAEAARAAEPAGRPVVLAVDGLHKRFGGIAAVNGVTFDLHDREILGVIGPNGAGKTTVFDLVSGFLLPDFGTVTLLGQDVTRWSPDRRAHARLGRSFQDARLFPSLTVSEAIAVALERHVEIRDPFLIAAGVPAVEVSEGHVAERVTELIELLGLQAYRDKFVAELSTGTRRIVDMACALAHDPAVLLLDEPSSGIAQRETEALGPLLLGIRDRIECSIVVIEHDMPLITTVSDRLLALDTGTVVVSGPPHDVVNDPAVVASYLGSDQRVVARSGGSVSAGRARRRRATPVGGRDNGSRHA